MRKSQTKIDQLPDEILVHIFIFLSLISVNYARLTQRHWYHLLNDESLCCTLLLQDFPSFYPNKSAIYSSNLPPHKLYQKELKMNAIIRCIIFNKTIPRALKQDDVIWKTLYQRIYQKPKEHETQWRRAFCNKIDNMRWIQDKFHLLVRSGYVDILKSFIENVKNFSPIPECKNQSIQNGLLLQSIVKDNCLTIQATITELINHKDNGFAALHVAAFKGYTAIARLLINNHANVNLATKHGNTPLHIATQNEHIKIVKLLINNHADVNRINKFDEIPLNYAARFGNLKIAKLFIDNYANVNHPSQDGSTPLFIAAQVGNLDMVKLLIQNGADHQEIAPGVLNRFPNVTIICQKVQAELYEQQQRSSPTL